MALLPKSHHGSHLCPEAGAPLLVVLVVVVSAERTHVPTDAGALGDVGAGCSRLSPVFHFGRKLTVSNAGGHKHETEKTRRTETERRGQRRDREREREEGTDFRLQLQAVGQDQRQGIKVMVV